MEYAENPDKTTDTRYLDKDLAATLKYAENEHKTDCKMYVTGINCITEKAYETMMATKQRYGKTHGGNTAYHGYQSFKTGELTPEECHEIGIETARRLWGKDYEVLVTTHLNTDNLHNHFVVNSVSFRTGYKFQNKKYDHYRLREISDEICRERGLSVLEDSHFYGGMKREYWIKRSDQPSHKDIVRADVETALASSVTDMEFERFMKNLGYTFVRDMRYAYPSVKLPGWKKAVRLNSLDIHYNRNDMTDRIMRNYSTYISPTLYKPKKTPLLDMAERLEFTGLHTNDTARVLVCTVFSITLMLMDLLLDAGAQANGYRPHSPSFKVMLASKKELEKELFIMKDGGIETVEDLEKHISDIEDQIKILTDKRQRVYNRRHILKTPEERQANSEEAKAFTEKIEPLRKQLKTARSALKRFPVLWENVKIEFEKEMDAVREADRMKAR